MEQATSRWREQGEDVGERLLLARVLVEIDELGEAEAIVDQILEDHPDDLTALGLAAKIKHIRGELSQAIAYWRQIHVSSPHNETALMVLGSLLHAAQHPERGIGHFITVGGELIRVPTAQLELEESFRLFLARRPDDAGALCDRLARKYERRDPGLFKLAVLARAWIAELSGQLQIARVTLEELGLRRGYETDLDRVLALVRVYERLGTPSDLQSAIHICRHLEHRFERLSTLSRMAVLYRRLGETAQADQYERRFLDAFRGRMQRPTRHEVTRIASQRYIPLDRLARVRAAEPGPSPADGPPRERALSLALAGDHRGARALLSAGAAVLDRKYLADLAARDGDRAGAEALYLDAVAADPGDLAVLGWLLDHLEAGGGPAVAEALRRPELGERAHTELERAVRARPLEAARWRHLATLHRVQGRAEAAERCARRAAALARAGAHTRRPIGRALAAAVYHFAGKAMGLIHEVWAERQPTEPGRGGYLDELLGNFTPDMRQNVRNTFLSVREYARAKFPERTADVLDYRYTYKVTKDDEPSGGVSAGLPSALAFLSVLLQQPLPQDVASTGELVADAHDVLVVRRIGDPEYKVKAAYHRNLSRLILPSDNRRELAASPLVPRQIAGEIVCYVADLDHAVTEAFGDDVWLG